MSKVDFLTVSSLLKEGAILLLFIVLSGCSPESSTQQTRRPENAVSIPKPHTSVKDVGLGIEKTRQVYQWYCTQCHGIKGHGDGINAPYLVVPPRDHTKAAYLETRSDQQLFETIKLGGVAVGRAPCMPAWGHTFDDKTIRSLVSYIRDLCNCEAL